MGLNEAAGYVAVSLSAIAAGYLAARMRCAPAILARHRFALAGLHALALLRARVAMAMRRHEAALLHNQALQTTDSGQSTTAVSRLLALKRPLSKDIFLLTSRKNRTLFGVSQAGLVNKL